MGSIHIFIFHIPECGLSFQLQRLSLLQQGIHLRQILQTLHLYPSDSIINRRDGIHTDGHIAMYRQLVKQLRNCFFHQLCALGLAIAIGILQGDLCFNRIRISAGLGIYIHICNRIPVNRNQIHFFRMRIHHYQINGIRLAVADTAARLR